MPRSTSDAFKQEKNKLVKKPLHLYILHDYDGVGTNYYFTDAKSAITFDSVEYSPFPISFDSVKENNRGQIDTTYLKVSNIRRYLQAEIETADLRGKKVTIRTVFRNLIADSTSVIDDIYYIDAYTATKEDINFTLTSKLNVLNVSLPLRTYSRNMCQWAEFKNTECGYTGAATECVRTKAACKALGNFQRFGGFPSILGRRVIAA